MIDTKHSTRLDRQSRRIRWQTGCSQQAARTIAAIHFEGGLK